MQCSSACSSANSWYGRSFLGDLMDIISGLSKLNFVSKIIDHCRKKDFISVIPKDVIQSLKISNEPKMWPHFWPLKI